MGAARTRILLWYVAILLFIFLVGIPVFRQLLFARVDQRVKDDMVEKLEVFQSLLAGELIDEDIDNPSVDEAWLENKDARLKTPYIAKELEEFFDAFLSRQVPEDEVYLIAFVNGEFYKSSPRGRPIILKKDSPLMQQWAKATEAGKGVVGGNDPEIGDLLYFVEPVKLNDQVLGTFVVAHTTAGERAEVVEALMVVIQVLGGVLLVSLILAWFASGQVLAPLRSLITTAKLVSESDLGQRLPLQGGGEMAELATTFNDMMDRLQAAFESQRNFINDAGHELRTPVTIIRGHLELMDDDPQEREETVALVLDELDRMARMVDDLVLLAKSDRPDFLQYELVDVRNFTEELFAKVRGLADRNWDLAEVAQGKAEIDRYRITQTVVNLAHNAVQHTQIGDRISIGSAMQHDKLHLWVQDTGEGIPLTDQVQIFERFARVAKSRRRSEGSGLGLSIVKAIVESHGGRIVLNSQLRFGSTFTLILPLHPAPTVINHDTNSDR
ncbi:MAG: HAMP domain-containing histidine kinase [Synechococcales cyanobacterium CRU_2_2]|nr:HAMP domain-containing histidine kinase [Synechococcales cyanobacterium CRU_2_2]